MQIPLEMQVTSKCECHKTQEGLQNCKLRCWKKGQSARGHCGRRDLVFDFNVCMMVTSQKNIDNNGMI